MPLGTCRNDEMIPSGQPVFRAGVRVVNWTRKATNLYGFQIAETSLNRNRLARIRRGCLPSASISFGA